MEKQRTTWIDVAKGMGIILVIVGHSSIPKVVSDFIWAFHMPLFFVLSGWCTDWGRSSISGFIIHKLKTLMVPFFIYSAIVLLIEYLVGISDITLWLHKGWQGYALWFVPVLFVSSIIARIIFRFKRYFVFVGGVLCLILGASLKYANVSLPWTMSSVPYAAFLIIAGSQMKALIRYIEQPKVWIMLGCFLLTVIISHFWRLDMAWNIITPVIPITLGAVAGVFMMCTLSSFISQHSHLLTRLLQSIGKETFIVLAFSQVLSMTIINCTTVDRITRNIIVISLLVAIKYIKDWINFRLGYRLLR